ncbi:MAG: hypothetical protein JNK74_00545 [Candidatus Hydrogenedentes bacterium]|nr:hypothetical protein [Candidatus Hydrogenedentota bacterium]
MTQRPSTREERRAKTPATLPERFEPRFWETTDQRQGVVKEIRRRLEALRDDAGVDRVQKEMLVRRAIFISIQLETMEVQSVEGGEFQAGVYTQMTNALSGLLSKLGLEQQTTKKVVNLHEYVNGGDK